MTKPQRSGRGLDARRFLFGHSGDLPKIIDIDLKDLRANPEQPRRQIDAAALQELAASIERHGLLQPIVVQKLDDSADPDAHLIVAGERRYRAYQLLGRTSIPALRTQGQPDELALIENIQREDLSALEEADAYQRLLQRHGYSQGDLASVVGKGRKTVNELLQIAALPAAIKSECQNSGIAVSKSLLLEIAREPDPQRQQALWEQVRNGLVGSKRDLEQARKTAPVATPPSPPAPIPPLLRAGRSFRKRLEAIQARPGLLSAAEQEELRALHQRLTVFFADLDSAEPD